MASKSGPLAVIKKRPGLTTAVVIGGVALVILFTRGGSSAAPASGSSQSMGYTDMQVAAASQVAAMQGQLTMQANDIQGQLALANIASSTQLAIAQQDRDMQESMAAFSLQANRDQIGLQLAGLQSAERVQLFGMETSAQIQQMTLQTQLLGMQAQYDRDQEMYRMMTDAQVNMSMIGATVQLAGISAQENIAHHTLDATTQQIKFQNELQLGLAMEETKRTGMATDAQKYGAKQAAKKDKYGMIGGLIGGVFSLICDIEIKTIEGCVSTAKCLDAVNNSPLDFWRYMDSSITGGTLHVGTYAQDFYRELGANDWHERKHIEAVDMFGALMGAVKELSKTRAV